ncbi:MAG: type I-E CRISPR-associated protein Cse1/CasA [Holophaga sp.]|nr:type I-E CRISPR-associated protein Cse1/CasA [Holophaga sp.]
MSRFNLIDEPWIPVRFPDGTRELGIKETLLQAGDILAIEDTSPLVVAALHRFLLAVLYRALEGPADINQARALFRGGIPAGKVTAYLDHWRQRFWLFDEHFPFGQIPAFIPKQWRAWTVLAAEHNADNAKVLFDHIAVEAPGMITEAAATRWLLAAQTFSVSCGKSELSHTGTAPSATVAMALPLGRNLSDTLLFALVPQSRDVLGQDLPLWERMPETLPSLRAGVERVPSGLADRFTWRTRSILFGPSAPAGGITSLAFASGVSCAHDGQLDPMVGYRIDETKGLLPIQFRERGLWRDFDSFMPDDSNLAPASIQHAINLARQDSARFPRAMMVLGQSNNKAKIEYWRMERFALPGALAGERSIRSDIRRLLGLAEETEKALWSSCSSYAGHILGRGERTPEAKDIRGFVAQMVPIPHYWTAVEGKFHNVLQGYTLGKDPDEIELDWRIHLRAALKNAWDQHYASVGAGDAWAIRATVMAEGPVQRKLNDMSEQIKSFHPKEVS